jgi:2-oxoglutarate dehydrogenase E1 component
MGAWTFVAPRIEAVLEQLSVAQARLVYAGRRPAASTATGLYQQHVKEQATLIEAALTGGDVEVAGTA